MLTLNTNTSNMFVQRQLLSNSNALSKSLARLSSGMRINSAKDDAAGLQISNRLTSQINGLNVAVRNANDGISMAQTAEGALKETTNILFRMRDLALQSANGSMSTVDREALNKEGEQLKAELNRINKTTSFGSQQLFDVDSDTPIVDAQSRDIIKQLQSGLLAEAEQIISDQYGLTGTGISLKIDLENIDGVSGKLASVSYLSPGGGEMTMTIDLDDFATMDQAQIDNFNGTILHEITHAVMASNDVLVSTPTWFAEGAAEAIRGADGRVAGDISGVGVAGIKSNLNTLFGSTSNPSGAGEIAGIYSGGYITMRYLEDKIGSAGIKTIMSELKNGQSFDNALNTASGGTYTDANALQTELMAGTVFEDYVSAMNLSNTDNGALGGADASGGSVRANTIIGASSASTTQNFVTSFVSGDNDSDNSDFGTTINYGATGLSEVLLDQYNPSGNAFATKKITFQIGASANETIDLKLGGFSTTNLALESYNLVDNPQGGISSIDDALSYVDRQRADIGAFINRLEHTISNLNNIAENTSASRSRIRDTDFALETAQLTKSQIQQQVITAMMAQSAKMPQMILSLLG